MVGGLRKDQLERYARHLVLPGVGEEGQSLMLDSSVLVVGAGGLGSPALMYLAAAGIGSIGIIIRIKMSMYCQNIRISNQRLWNMYISIIFEEFIKPKS